MGQLFELARFSPDFFLSTSCALLSDKDFDSKIKYIKVKWSNKECVLLSKTHSSMESGTIYLDFHTMRYIGLEYDDQVEVSPHNLNTSTHHLWNVILEVETDYNLPEYFICSASTTHDTDEMAVDFLKEYSHHALNVGFRGFFSYGSHNDVRFVVKELKEIDLEADTVSKVQFGVVMPGTNIVFQKKPNTFIHLIGSRIVKDPSIIASCSNNEQGRMYERKNFTLCRRNIVSIMSFEHY